MKTIMPFLLLLIAALSCKKEAANVSKNSALSAGSIENSATDIKHRNVTFDVSNQGWKIEGDGNGFYSSTAGNPGGCIYATDQSTGIFWYFKAPENVLDAVRESKSFNHSLKFDLKAPTSGNTQEPDVQLVSENYTLVCDFPNDPNDVN